MLSGSTPVSRTKPRLLWFQGIRGFFIAPQRFQGIRLRVVRGVLRDVRGLFRGKNAHASAHEMHTGFTR